MKKKSEKLPELSTDFREQLALLSARKEFSAFEKLCKIEENNIIIENFKLNSSNPDLARKKAFLEGRMWELRKILKTFDEVKKQLEKEQ